MPVTTIGSNTALTIRSVVIIVTLVNLIWDLYLDLRQYLLFLKQAPPAELKLLISSTSFQKSQSLNSDKLVFSMIKKSITSLIVVFIIELDIIPQLWNISHVILVNQTLFPKNEIVHSCIFTIIDSIIFILIGFPFDLYLKFVILRRHYVFNPSLGVFMIQKIKKSLLHLIFSVLTNAGLLYFIFTTGSQWPIFAAGFLFLAIFTLIIIYPEFIKPMFSTFTPLPDGQLKTSIEALANKVGFPCQNIYITNSSIQGTHSNAYILGLLPNYKYLVLTESIFTTFDKHPEYVVAIVAHELGHWKNNHPMLKFLNVCILISVFFGIVSYVHDFDSVYLAFGFGHHHQSLSSSHFKWPPFLALYLLYFIGDIISTIFMSGNHFFSRMMEYEADKFATLLLRPENDVFDSQCSSEYYDLKNPLQLLHLNNKAIMIADPLFSFFNFSHPTLVERLHFIDKVVARRNKNLKKHL